MSKTYVFQNNDLLDLGSDGKSAYEIAVDNGFQGTEQQWLESLQGVTPTVEIDSQTKHWIINGSDTGIVAEGQDGEDGTNGYTPTVEIDKTTKHWIINDVDTGVVAEGKDGTNGINGTNGSNGQDGHDGQDGYSPTATVVRNNNDNGVVITITDINGTTTAQVYDGKDGEDAEPVTVPTKTSDLTNDSNFVSDSNYVHTDNNFSDTYKNNIDNAVPNTRKINNKPLNADITLSASDIGAQVAGSYAASDHTHDDRYFTETEINTLLSGKSDTGHTHSQYLTEHQPVDSSLDSTSTNPIQNAIVASKFTEIETILNNLGIAEEEEW